MGDRLVMALWVFLGLYIGLTLFLLIHGYVLVGQIKKLVN